MTKETIRVRGQVSAAPTSVYDAWIDGEGHGAMTGAGATSDPVAGGAFTAWGGYIEGTHVTLEAPRRIVQRWRSSDFPEGADDSLLEVRFEPLFGGATEVTFTHSEIPAGQGANYAKGWEDYYLTPMRAHFSKPKP